MRRALTAAATIALVANLALSASADPGGQASYETVSKAKCGPKDRPEAGLQGQVPASERASGFDGYSCNLKVIGQFNDEGSGIQHASYGDCAYYSTSGNPEQEHPGVVVLDVSHPTKPKPTDRLDEPAMINPWESLKVHQRRGLLAAVEYSGPGFSIYDIKKDCRHPKLLGTIVIPEARGHAGNFSHDGTIYYGADFNGEIYAIDLEHPNRPNPTVSFNPPGGVHDLSTNEDGTKLYVADSGRVFGVHSSQNGLVTLDVSEIAARKENPQVETIAELYWDDGGIAQMTQKIYIDDKPYILFTDEAGAGGLTGWHHACAAGLPPFGFARLIDISNESKPKIVSKLMLEVHDPANCPLVMPETVGATLFMYDSHYCSVDAREDARLLACGYYESGLRVFDIRDPKKPREIAYYNPPAQHGPIPPGASYLSAGGVQWELSMPQLRLEDCQIWITTSHTSFRVLKLTNNVWPCGINSSADGMS